MKNFKRIAAILGIVVLLAVCCLPMVFAFGSGENAAGMCRAIRWGGICENSARAFPDIWGFPSCRNGLCGSSFPRENGKS